MAGGAVEKRERSFETTCRRVVFIRAEVPLAGHVGVVSGIDEQLGDRHDVTPEMPLVARFPELVLRRGTAVAAQPGAMRIDPRHHGSPCRAAIGEDVELRQRHPLGRQGVDVGRGDLRPENADVRVAQVVGNDEQNVRSRGLRNARYGRFATTCGRH